MVSPTSLKLLKNFNIWPIAKNEKPKEAESKFACYGYFGSLSFAEIPFAEIYNYSQNIRRYLQNTSISLNILL